VNRLNYFFPYNSKSEWHEDNLTRAFLIVLRFSPVCLNFFYDYLLSEIREECLKSSLPFNLKTASEIDMGDVEILTQQSSFPEGTTNQLISVFITDEKIQSANFVESSSRSAVYDGLIRLGEDLLIVIENKPNSGNIWLAQANPSEKNLRETTTEIIKVNPKLEWKKIITIFRKAIEIKIISGQEKLIVNDFFEFVDGHFSVLNPFDNLSLCKNNNELIEKRIKNILEEIASNPEDVFYHRSWSHYIKTNFNEIQQMALRLSRETEKAEDWNLIIDLSFADTATQAFHFYQSVKTFKPVQNLIENGWNVKTNFHLGFRASGLVWMDRSTDIEKIKNYFEFWHDNPSTIRMHKKEKELPELLNSLDKINIVNISGAERDELERQIYKKNYQSISVRPSILVEYYISASDAMKMDKEKTLVKFVSTKMKEALFMLQHEITFLK
jgi:hypothetical protein